jgi:hypothetical protein
MDKRESKIFDGVDDMPKKHTFPAVIQYAGEGGAFVTS